MRTIARQDSNHAEIRQVFRDAGLSTLDLHQLKGACDLLVGGLGCNILIEIKDGSRKPSERRLTPDEEKFHARWLGPLFIVETVEQARTIARQMLSIDVETESEVLH